MCPISYTCAIFIQQDENKIMLILTTIFIVQKQNLLSSYSGIQTNRRTKIDVKQGYGVVVLKQNLFEVAAKAILNSQIAQS